MIPKVAANLLHASKAAGPLPSLPAYLRNVLQLQGAAATPTTGAGASTSIGWGGATSSSWGGNAGAGGAKFNAGSKFYAGYTGPGRAITQANSSSSQSDDADEAPLPIIKQPLRDSLRRPRLRSASFSLGTSGSNDRAESLGVLKAVQMHTSSRQIFTKADRPTVDSAAIIISAVKTPEQRTSATPASPAERPSSTVLVRRNSTSSLATSPADIVELPPSLLTSKPTATSKSKITRQSPPATPASQDDSEAGHLADVQLWRTLLQAKEDGDVERVQAEVKAMRESSSALSTQMYNIAMDALMTVRTPGQPINIILELYNELLTRGLRPNSRTYRHVINALCERDHEIHKVLAGIDRRVKRSTFIQTGRGDSEAAIAEQQQRAANLRDEPNFTSALALFRAGIAFAPTSLPSAIYNVLLRSCAYHKNVDAAVLVYGHLEKVMPGERGAFTFANLISVYASVGDFGAIQEVFKEYLAGATAGTIKSYDMRLKMIVWNRMIEAGFLCSRPDESVKVFEQMLDSAVIAELASDAAPPKPSASTYTAVVQGFCEMGDVDSALAWFDQLLAQNAAVHDPYIPLSEPARPTRAAWVQILSALTEHHRAEDLNRLFSVLLERRESDNLEIRSIDVEALVAVNIRSIRSSGDAQEANEQLSTLTGTLTRIFHDSTISPLWMQHPVQSLVQELSTHNRQNDAAVLMESFVRSLLESPAVPEEHRSSGPFLSATREFYAACVETIFANGFVQSPPSLQTALSLARLGDNIGSHIMWPHCARLYADMRIRNEPVELTEQDKADLVEAFCYPASPGPIDGEFSLAIFLEELAKDAPDSLVPLINWRSVAQALTATHGVEQARAVLDMFNPTIAKNVLPSPPSSPTSLRSAAETLSPSTPPTSVAAIEIDHKLSRYIDEHQNSRSGVSPMAAYDIFENGLVKGLYPSPETLGRLINALGRLQQTDKVHRLYAVAQDVLASLEHDKQWQTQGWFQIEDHMIVALAHSGSFEAASVHRYRIIENGGAPSPDAYGALITAVKDTTDDTTVARELWDESQRLGVTGNLFLYNTIISKLSKARKADYALELFHRMRMEGIRPSSVTYGALIGACCRVGDEQSAEYLFAEMTSMKNFKARVPPFNTMMQFYTSTKPDRERALHYYDALLRSGVRPTAHTYKLLLDAYGSIEPADTASMEGAFEILVNDPTVQVNGAHWASVINTWGSVYKDLDRALAVFDSIPTHPTTLRSSTPQPDAVTYEALINCLVTMKRIDLLPTYLQRLYESGIHMTAYIANFLIKGYAAAGNMDMARQIFENLHDAPIGVAAPNNHVTHDEHSEARSRDNLVYREPSTWEAMVRAELGVSERGRALELLTRMESRMFPPAVTARIRGILGDDIILDEQRQ